MRVLALSAFALAVNIDKVETTNPLTDFDEGDLMQEGEAEEMGYVFETEPVDEAALQEALEDLPQTNAEVDAMEVQLNDLVSDIDENLP